MADKIIQWHPGFAAAIDLEFAANRQDLIYEREYNLNTKPLVIDLLVIKKKEEVQIENKIGAQFRKYNLLEYKSPDDSLNIDTFYKTTAYACLYKSYGKTVDEIPANEITISIIRDSKPYGLFHYFENNKIKVTNPYRGIYYIKNEVPFPTQIIVTKELDTKYHTWLKSLSDKLGKQEIKSLLEKIEGLNESFDRRLADSVLEVAMQANKEIVKKLRGDESMCQALWEIMEPEISQIVDERTQKRVEEEKQKLLEEQNQSILRIVARLRKLGTEDVEIKEILMEDYRLSSEKANAYIS